MKLYYFVREENDAFIVERYDSEDDDCNKEVFRGNELPVWLDDLQEGVNLFYVEYSDKGDCYVL